MDKHLFKSIAAVAGGASKTHLTTTTKTQEETETCYDIFFHFRVSFCQVAFLPAVARES